MSHYEERLEQDLTQIKEELVSTSLAIEEALDHSICALLSLDTQLAYRTILEDQIINRAVKEIDRLCHSFVARHLPSAGHLRFVSSVLRINIALERIGDYAVTICRETARLSFQPPQVVLRDLDLVVDESKSALRQALEAFFELNPDLARATKAMASTLGKGFDKVFEDLVSEGEKESRPTKDLFSLLVIFNRLSRVCDQSQNICEETIFAATGETKGPKRCKILFVDRKNVCTSQMAEAIIRKAFPEETDCSSAGWEPGEGLSPSLVEFMDRNGHDLGEARPCPLPASPELFSHYDILVCLDEEGAGRLPELPYHTVVLKWKVPTCDEDRPAPGDYEQVYRTLTGRINDLMDVLTGSG